MAHEHLATYLNDHLGGSTAALEMLDHLAEVAATADDKAFFKGLHVDISADRQTLEEIIRRVGDTSSQLRHLGGWISEKVLRLKLAVDDPPGNSLKHFESLEVLLLGIHGKRGLWQVLRTIAPGVPPLQHFDYADLDRRASEQYSRVDARRLQLASQVFVSPAAAV